MVDDYITVSIDCNQDIDGVAYIPVGCSTCIGGNTGLTECPREIKRDTSITNNVKINCLMEKLLGLNGNTANPEFTSLLNAFKNKGFDVTFKIGTTEDANSKGETGADPNNHTKYNIVLNRNKINSESQMSWVKTLLHEAFHANLIQKSYETFGAAAVNMWPKKIEAMTLEENANYFAMKAFDSGNPLLLAEHHDFMAENIMAISEGLRSFSLANNPNHSDYNNYHFGALAFEGLHETSYYLNKVIKNSDGSLKLVEINGHQMILRDVNASFYKDIKNEAIPCN